MRGEVDALGAAARGANGGTAALATGSNQLSTAAAELARSQGQAGAAAGELAAGERRAGAAAGAAAGQIGNAARAAEDAARAQRQAGAAAGQLGAAQREAAAGAGALDDAATRMARSQANTAAQAAAAAREVTELARAERDAAQVALRAAEVREAASQGRILLTPENPVTRSTDPQPAAGNAAEQAAATEAVTAARRAADEAEAAYAARLRDSTEAAAGAQAAARQLAAATSAQAGAAAGSNDAIEQGAEDVADLVDANRQAAQAAREGADAAGAQGAAARGASDAAGDHADALTRGASAADRAAREAAELAAAEQRLAAATSEDERAAAAAAIAAIRLAQAQRSGGDAARRAAADQNRHGFAVRNAGQQFGDFGLQVASGQDPVRAFQQQIGQLGYAMSEMQGRVGALGRFLVGPWGIALTVAAAFVVPLVQELFRAEEAADAAKLGADGLAEAQSALGKMFDLTSGKLRDQNELLVLNARLTAINLRGEALKERTSSQEAFSTAGTPTVGGTLLGIGVGLSGNLPAALKLAGGNKDVISLAGRAQAALATRDPDKRAAALDAVLRQSEKTEFKGGKVTRQEFQQAIIDAASSDAKDKIADLIDESLDDKKLAAGLRRDKKDRPKKPKSTAARDEFGRDAADRITSIEEQFSDTPPAVRQASGAVRQLNDLMDDLARKKPPGFREMIADAERVGRVVEDSINRPLDEYRRAQDQQRQIAALTAEGRVAEAGALRDIIQLERQRGPLSDEQRADVLATNQALVAQERQIERNQRRQSALLGTLGDIRSTIAQTIYEGPRSLTALPGRILESFQRLNATQIEEALFGDLFQQLDDQVTGTDVVEDASRRMAGAVDGVTTSSNGTRDAFVQLTRSILGASSAISSARTAPAGRLESSLLADGLAVDLSKQGGAEGDIVVTAARLPASINKFDDAVTLFNKTGRGIGQAIDQLLGTKGVGERLGSFAGDAAQAFTLYQAGIAVSDLVSDTLGLKKFAGGKLGILPNLLATLFAGSEKPGGVTVGAVDGRAGTTGTTGGDRDATKAAGSLGKAVSDGVNRVVEQLGGTLGAFNVSIGTYKGDLRVNENGQALGGVKNSGAVGFGEDETAAVAYAISRAVAQGAVQGLSSAVAQALQSSPDLDQAIAEALKVAELEKMLGGVTGQLRAVFDEFDRAAAERVTLAKRYGLDLVQIEKINAEQRAKLLDDTLRARVGQLQDVLSSLSFGDLFEGTAADRRTSILGEIADARADFDAGVDGAVDRLAELSRLLITTSRDAYGTAGAEYAGDRATGTAELQRAIQIERDRVESAAAARDAATLTTLAAGNVLSDEGNDLAAQQLAVLREIAAGMASGGSFAPDLSLVAR